MRAMPKKKGKKGGGKKKKDDGGAAVPVASSFQPLVLIPVTEQWVTLELKLLHWNYMNFQHRCNRIKAYVPCTVILFEVQCRI